MDYASRCRRCVLAAIFFLLAPCAANAQDSTQLTVTWIQSPEASAVAGTPTFRWLEDGRCVLYDRRAPAARQMLEVLEPSSGKRRKLVDLAHAFTRLRAELEQPSSRPLSFPVDIDGGGRHGVYLLSGDLFVLDFASEAFTRITRTPAEEKNPGFSPDGMKVAFVRENNLFVYDLAAGKEIQLTTDGSSTLLNGTLSWVYWEEVFGRRDTGYWWSPDSRAIAYFQSDESQVSIQHYVDFMPWTPRVITQRYPKVGEKNPQVRAGIVELESRATTWVNFGPHAFEYIVRAQWLPDGNRLSLQTVNRLQTRLDLFFADRRTGATTFILAENDSAWVNVLDDLVFLRDGRHFLWGSERDGYEHLYRYSLDGTLVNRVTNGNWAIRSAGGGVWWLRGGVVGVDEGAQLVYFTALEKSSIEKHLYGVRLDGSGMRRLSKEDGTHSVTFSPDARYYMDRFSNASTLPSLTLYDREGKERLRLASPRPQLVERFGLRYPEFFTIPARDGFPMPAQMLKPSTLPPGKKFPVIFYVYGGPSAPVVANAWQREIYWDNLLLQNGYLVVRCDNRSATGISATLEKTVSRRLDGEGELNDLVDAVRWVKSQPYVDSTRIGIWGWSGGGSCTMLGMTRSTEFKAGIAVAGVSDFRFYDTKWAEEVMKTEEVNREGFEQVSLLRYARNLHGRLLLVHGTYDDNVHIQNAWAFADELIKANKQFDMMIYPMRMHGISDLPARVHLYTMMLDFWRRNL